MTRFGFTRMTEQNGPRELVDAAVLAEEVGFDLLVSSDHYSPWRRLAGGRHPPGDAGRGGRGHPPAAHR